MRRASSVAILLVSMLFGPPLGAQPSAADEARTYFDAGAQAYEAGQYLTAVKAFERAYALAKRNGIIFSIAQAYRRQYYLDNQPAHLNAAIERYRDYLAKAPSGSRKGDAALALAELEAVASRLPAAGEDGGTSTPAEPAEATTRIVISSRTKGALVSLDGAKPKPAPLIAEVTPGTHRIRVTAEGYFDEESEVPAAEGGIVALQIPLRERPAELNVRAVDGAEVSVDGRVAGETPLLRPVELAAGSHLVTITKGGHGAFSEELVLRRGQKRTLEVALDGTGQRFASYMLLGVGVGGLVTGGVLSGIAFYHQSNAKDIASQLETESISADDLGSYNDALERRNDWRRGAGIAFGGGALVAATGLLLYVFDRPAPGPPTRREKPEPDKPDAAPAAPAGPMEIGAAPVWLEGGAMAVVNGRF